MSEERRKGKQHNKPATSVAGMLSSVAGNRLSQPDITHTLPLVARTKSNVPHRTTDMHAGCHLFRLATREEKGQYPVNRDQREA
jgi:hypothetical protein